MDETARGERPDDKNSDGQANRSEFSFFDLVNTFLRRKFLFLGTLAVFLLASVAYAVVSAPEINIVGRLEVGGRAVDGNFKPLENPETVAQRLKGEFVPTATQRLVDGGDGSDLRRSTIVAGINASTAPGTHIVRLSAMVSEDEVSLYDRIMSSALDQLQERHRQYVDIMKLSKDQRLEEIRNDIENLKDESGEKSAQVERVKTLQEQIRSEIDSLKQTIDQIQNTRMEIMSQTASVDASVATMFAANDLREARDLLNQKRERAYFQLPNRQDELETELSRIERDIEMKRIQLEELQAEAGLIRPTRLIEEPGEYLERQGTSPVVAVLLGGILGTVIGILTVVFAEFMAAARRHARA